MFCIIQADRPLLTSEIECSDPAANAELGTSSVSELLLESHCPSTTTRPAHRKLKLVGPGPNSRPHSMHGFGVEGTAGQRSLDPGFSPHRGASKSGIHGIHTKQAFMKSSGPLRDSRTAEGLHTEVGKRNDVESREQEPLRSMGKSRRQLFAAKGAADASA